ncbi:DUF7009 family protein [Chitinophaga pinensis]|uniref:Uncharacterized protein n=1 Tax=Chitinophaga pinensis (strain ATCC 43595 / DSM 2588 / LMG 13176 / NBRC 15968 / NCIMB 11800 / UQM 2034) TaxID=485918 RepID=A0A979GM29_CHIPD|nr:hypothetical protein [Chitinophaga pinensis]ACU57712.1 conserved hypothetical protein [Chitinophaga pinensis DSM 2588]
MKIRIRGNSIRYRLDKKDVDILKNDGKVEESTVIGAGQLHFCLKAKEGATSPFIKLEGPAVHLSFPKEQVRQWIDTDQVGFSAEIPNADGSSLHILVEKDFKCLTERNEDDSNAFDNPLESC